MDTLQDKNNKLTQKLVDRVIERIEEDILYRDHTSIDELLRFVPIKYLIGFLEEGEWVEYKNLTSDEVGN